MMWKENSSAGGGWHKKILDLAVPALGALLAEPLLLITDTIIAGHLGTTQLASLSLASNILLTVVSICIFFAYTTTSVVARNLGRGKLASAMIYGVNGIWLAIFLGIFLMVSMYALARPIITVMGAEPDMIPYAMDYLQFSLPGIPAMLVVLATTGILRGLQDTRSPLVVATGGAIFNLITNIVLVYVFGFGLAGIALGTAITQNLMALALLWVIHTKSRGISGLELRPRWRYVKANIGMSVPLFVRTINLRAAILLTIWAATQIGETSLAAHHIVITLWNFSAFVLDALAIAAQALVGRAVGAQDKAEAREVLRICLRWAIGLGVGLGVVLLAGNWLITRAFTADPEVLAIMFAAYIIMCTHLPLAGIAYTYDGVLMGAGDGRFLAGASFINLAAYTPMVLFVVFQAPSLTWLWVAFATGFTGVRALVMYLRARGETWMQHQLID